MSTNGSDPSENQVQEAPLKVDWVHLPATLVAVSLWESLHDGELRTLRPDLRRRLLHLEFHVPHLLDFHELPDDLLFFFELVNVTSARITRWSVWPGEFSLPKGLSPQEQNRLVADYQNQWREESDSWDSFESRLALGQLDVEISHAELAQVEGSLALRLNVMVDDENFQVLTMAAERLRINRSDGQSLTLDQFVQLGATYWEAFSRRNTGKSKGI